MKEQICGIYKIRNKTNNKIYTGQAVDIYDRWAEHIRALRGQYHTNNHLQRAWNKYGEDNFEFSIVEECCEDELDDREIYWIAEYDSYHNGYNQTLGGGGARGYKHSEETKKKKSEASSGEKAYWYGKCGEQHPAFGRKHTDEEKMRISESHKGMTHTEETKEKLKQLFIGENNPRYGTKHIEETKKKISKSHMEKKHSEESKNKMSVSQKARYANPEYQNPLIGRQLSEEHRKNLSDSHKGNTQSQETREKIGAALSIPVYCPELDEVFQNPRVAQDKYGINKSSIVKCCNGDIKSAGKHPVTGVPLRWCKDSERYKLKPLTDNRNVAVYCFEFDEFFDSAAQAGKKYNINPKSIIECCAGRKKSGGKHPITGEKLHWVYADKMDNSSVA